MTKKHSLHLTTSEFLRAEVDEDSTPSGFTIAARSLRDWLDHFSIALNPTAANRAESQLGWMFTEKEVRLKSWDSGSKELSTEIKVQEEEFDSYSLYMNKRVDLTLPMREFRVGTVA